jgi:phospholipase A1
MHHALTRDAGLSGRISPRHSVARKSARAALFYLALAPSAYAGGDIFLQCAQSYPGDDAGRLKCYDQLAAPELAPGPRQDIAPGQDAGTGAASNIPVAAASDAGRSYLTRLWNLDNQSNLDPSKLGRLQPYRQSYLLANWTDNPNRQPDSPAAGHLAAPPKDIKPGEIKFQLSAKADIGDLHNMDFMGIKTFRLWGAYTQQSYWQAFSIGNSAPFRETVYEPELIGTFGTGYQSGLKFINLGFVHQSNGRSLPDSRSWARVYVLGGWEWNDTTSIMLRGWKRLPENPATDDNPNITDYMGHGDLVIRWEPSDKSQSVAMLLRNNLSSTRNYGYEQIDWATPVQFGSAARVHIQLTSGYGESLIDYNHRQNTIGLGFSFREW